MKAKLTFVASLIFTAALATAADRIEVSQLPPAVKKTLDASAKGEPVKRVTVENDRGRTIYDIELERKLAPNPRLRIAADGEVLHDTTAVVSETPTLYPEYAPPVTPVAPKFKLSELPGPAQQTVKKEAAGREIASIEREEWKGHSGYRITFRERGRDPALYVGDDGQLLKPTEKPPTLFIGTRFEETPTAVQQTLRRQVGEGEIVKIEKEGRNGQPTTFKVSLKDARGPYEIRVSETGQVLENKRPTP